ncbi:FAD/NAD(P)-binding protein [Aureimonas leprariae]|uniref:NAD(P)-binding protein n=1 Tax=Plantimonas leprariae TaxID=2615207 RepID=A0A7V7PME7_9HYPH|nr:FAD/NAD(P)-binding protein [Aureimonas leprariae]KAB0677796.1 NAD(P)-binding protein [Aureimonas leprariae]
MSAGRVVIVGGGASGTILAAHILRLPGRPLGVTIVEERPEIGRGVAYGTTEPGHILNTRAASMSAFQDDPDHFWKWLLASGFGLDVRCSDPFCFVPRAVYAHYLKALLDPWRGTPDDAAPLTIVQGRCVGVRQAGGGVAVELADGTSLLGQAAVLATGHDLADYNARGPYVNPWTTPVSSDLAAGDPVLILGTGLSMIDTVIELTDRGHRGRITALSRRGLLPRTHRRNVPMRIDAADVPFGTGIAYLLRWFRRTAEWAATEGGDWRDVVDGVRPHTARLWQSLSVAERERFLRHARTWWEVHRHRMPPESEERLRAAMARGRLEILAARFVGSDPAGDGVRVRFRRRGSRETETVDVAKVVDCTGILRGPDANRAGIVASLIEAGTARPDPCRIGIKVDESCAVIDGGGKPAARLFAVGPVTRAQFWEITAVPDIRVQCAALAGTIADRLGGESGPAHR